MFRVTFVCTGNRCRSPLAAGLMRSLVGDMSIEIDSCGTLDAEDQPSPTETILAARALGVDLTDHRSRHLSRCGLEAADLVLGFEYGHVAAAVVEGEASPSRTFLLSEFIRLAGDPPSSHSDPEAAARAVVAAAAAARDASSGFVPGEEIEDPIGRPADVHAQVAGQLGSLCRALVRSLWAPRDTEVAQQRRPTGDTG